MTEDEKKELKEAVLAEINAESSDVTELEEVSALDGVKSLPAMSGTSLVSVPIELLSKPATDAAAKVETAIANANNMATKAAVAATSADTAASKANTAAAGADSAASKATAAAGKIDSYESRIASVESTATEAKTSADEAVAAAAAASAAASTADAKAEEAIVKAGETKGGNTFNATAEAAPVSGYHTLATAVAAVPEKRRERGLCVTYEESQGKWVTRQFAGTSIDSWETTDSWQETGGGGTVKSVTVNGERQEPDESGNVAVNIAETEVDASLDEESTNPVENRVVAAKVAEIEAHTLGSIEVVADGDENYLYAYDPKGNTIGTPAKLPAGGGGGGTSSASRILVTAKVAPELIKEGGSAQLTWTYDHVNAEGESDGVQSTVTITVKMGTTTLWTQETRNVSKGTYTADLSQYTGTAGNVDVYVRAECTTAEGEQQSKQAYAKVTVVAMRLTSDYDIATAISRGGYQDGETISIPFTLTGTGQRTVSMYVDGSAVPTTKDVSKSGTTRDTFTIQASTLKTGRHTVQIVAERDGLKSDVIWIDLLKGGGNEAWIGMKYADTTGEPVTGEMPLTAHLTARQYDKMEFDYAAYDPKETPATVTETQTAPSGAITERTYSVGRGKQTYSSRYLEAGDTRLKLTCGGATLSATIDVETSGMDIGEATQGLELKLTASGRSNTESEEQRSKWESGGHGTTFSGVDWATSGWDGTALVLKNGASATVDYKPFLTDVKTGGCTVEIDIAVSNILNREAVVVDCMENDTKGLRVTAESAMLYSGSTKDREDEENTDPDTGKPIVTKVPVGVKQNYAEDRRVKFAFIVGKKSEGALMELYMNGDRVGAMCYQEDDNFKQDTAQGITITSDGADVKVYGIRAYSRPLTDDEEVDNNIVDSSSVEEMAERYAYNNILNPETGEIDMDKIMAKGRAVIRIVRTEDSGDGLDDVNASKNKKQDFHVDELTIYTPWGDVIRLTNIIMRIQGTSSTKYPVKNYRFYWAKCMKAGLKAEMWINGVKQDTNKMPLFKDDPHPCKVDCAKADFSDSSMKTNTGMAIVYNDVMKEISPTPPQQTDPTIRSAIYGYPCDIFATTSADDSQPKYYGQYQMNNDKSDWYSVLGLTDAEKDIALEFLDNGKKLCNFQVDDDLDTQLDEEFASSLEFNYPKDTLWSGADEADGEKNASEYQKGAIKKLWSWIKSCVPEGADMTCKDLSTWKSAKFKAEFAQHRNFRNTAAYYLIMTYGANVDQFVKNTVHATWDGEEWWFIYYDGDTSYGKRNDSLLAYAYNVMRDSWDGEKKKWVFEGHDSWMWCLFAANFEDEIKALAEELRKKLTNEKVKGQFESTQKNWSTREYNKSGEMKYITPETKGVRVTENGVTTDGNRFYYMYALSGTREMQMDYFITNRFALLDAKYGVSTYRADSAAFYMARSADDAADVIRITSADEYYFSYGLSGKDYMEGETGRLLRGETGELRVTGKRALNDPMLLFGASRIMELDMREAGSHLLNGLELGNCRLLRRLDISVGDGGTPSTTTWWLVTQGCKQLQEVNLHGQTNARSNRQDSTALDFSTNTLLKKIDAGGTSVRSVTVAKGAPVESMVLPATLTTLRLEYLPKLTAEGLTLEGTDNVETLVFDTSPGLDWKEIYAKCKNLKTLRVAGLKASGDGTELRAIMEAGLKGVDDDGGATDRAVLKGEYRLTKFADEDELEQLSEWFGAELKITQPEYTDYMEDDLETDPENVTNWDNQTGYKPGNDYVRSGHILKIREKTVPVRAKLNVQGKMHMEKISEADYRLMPDGESSNNQDALGEGNDFFMYVPNFWYKGINDFKNQQKHTLLSANKEKPADTWTRKNEPKLSEALYKDTSGLAIDSLTIGEAIADEAMPTLAACAVYRLDVEGMKQARYIGLLNASYGSAFTDAEGCVIQKDTLRLTSPSTTPLDFSNEQGDYIYRDVPKGAKWLYFTCIRNLADENVKILAVDSDDIEAIEPGWELHKSELIGIYCGTLDSLKQMRSVAGARTLRGNGTQVTSAKWQYDSEGNPTQMPISAMNYTSQDMLNLCRMRGKGYHSVSYEQNKTIAMLSRCWCGNRDDQQVYGFGCSADYVTGGKDSTGSEDTTKGNGGANKIWGLEGWVACCYEVMDNVAVNVSTFADWKAKKRPDNDTSMPIDAKWHIYDEVEKTERVVQGLSTGGYCIARLKHGRYCDIVASSMNSDKSKWNTCYATGFYYSADKGRCVCRALYSANANGGCVCAYAYYGSSYSGSYSGVRLAFNGDFDNESDIDSEIAKSEEV